MQKEFKNNISVITCSMNREYYLKKVLESTNKLDNLCEHIIVDYSSSKPLSTDLLKINPKSKLVRVVGEKKWWLSRAYNFAASVAKGNILLKLDADTLINAENINKLQHEFLNFNYFGFEFNKSLGNFLIKKSHFDEINGFNEYIYNWGYDDIDLQKRVSMSNSTKCKVLNGKKYINILNHPDKDRFNTDKNDFPSLSLALHKKNRFIAENTNWDIEKILNYEQLEEDVFKINHFYTLKNLNLFIRQKYKIKFFQVYLNEKYNTNVFNRLSLLLYFVPYIFLKKVYKYEIYP